MISVITGDIINSTSKANQDEWLMPLKKALQWITADASNYEIFRGDSFQIECKDYENSFKYAMYIKACIKCVKNMDVRLSIGVGAKTYQGKKVSQSNGEAFIYSGQTLEDLKKEKVNLKITTSQSNLNEALNLYFKLALIAMDHWTTNSAEIVKLTLEYPNKIQSELAVLLGISQDAVSKRQKRAYLDEIKDLDKHFRIKINNLK